MTRLRHSARGLIRSMQISRAALNIFVEGEYVDGYFYSKIAHSESSTPFTYRIIRSNQLPTPGSGKKHLLTYFKLLRRRNMLMMDFKGKRSAVLFFLDKDVDDLRRTKVRSQHVVYTEHYEVENYLYRHGNIIEVSAAACSADIAQASDHFGSSSWPSSAADRWRDWVKLCLAAVGCQAHSVCNYHSPSEVHDGGVVDPTLLADKLVAIEAASNMGTADFMRMYDRLSSKVDRLYMTGAQDRVFKGKWYTLMLADELRAAGLATGAATRSLPAKLVTGLMQSLDFSEDWTNPFRLPIRRLTAAVAL
jgi:hypothetical protein